MKNKMLQTIKKHNMIEKDMHIIVGLSGGPDSVCLFDSFLRISEERPDLNLHFYTVHVNHKFRPGAAEEDQKYVEELCKERAIPCFTFVTDCTEMAERLGMTSEEAGRKARYDAFSEIAVKIAGGAFGGEPVPKEKIAIALAHNANDQCETILFRIMRGSGTDGLAGIAYKRFDKNGFSIIRPVLDLTRREIEEYCEKRNLSPRIDHTNSENIYTRNKIRNMLIPYIEENFNENITETINRLGKIASYDRNFIRDASKKAYNETAVEEKALNRKAFNTEKLKELHKSIRMRIYTMALENIGMEENLAFSHLEAADEILYSQNPSASVDISAEYKALREYDKLIFVKTAARGNSAAKTIAPSDTSWKLTSMTRREYEDYKKQGRFHGAFCGVDIAHISLRKRREGDKIDIGTGYKKLQDFFVDEKLPKHYRDDVDVLAAGSRILWIMPSEHYKRPVMKEKGRFSAAYKLRDDYDGPIIVLEKL